MTSLICPGSYSDRIWIRGWMAASLTSELQSPENDFRHVLYAVSVFAYHDVVKVAVELLVLDLDVLREHLVELTSACWQ